MGEVKAAGLHLPENADVWMTLASIKDHQEDYQAAYQALERAAALDPKDPAILVNLGLFMANARSDF